MKTACLFVLTIGLAVLMHGMADAAPESQAASADGATMTVRNHSSASSQEPRGDRVKDQKNGADLDDQRAHHDILKKNLVRGHANLTPTKRATLVPNNRARSESANVTSPQQRDSTSSGGAQRKVSIRKETVISTMPVRPLRIVRPSPATLNNVRHRSPNPAIISGLVDSKTRAGAINGNRMGSRR